MPSCEMCGSRGRLFRTSVEGAEMMICKECLRFGKVLAAPKIIMKKESLRPKREAKPEIIEVIVPEYAGLVREKREKLGLRQEELAKRINERKSIIQKIEAGKFDMSIALAKKLEQFLKIKLIEIGQEESVMAGREKAGPVTIGDVIKIRMRKG